MRKHWSLVNIKCCHVASSRKVTGWDASRADSTKTPLCVQSVCVCVSLLDRTSYRHTFTPTRTHLSALCVTGLNPVSPADSAQPRQPEPTQTDTFVFSVVVVLLYPSCGSDPTLAHHCGIVYFLRFPSWVSRLEDSICSDPRIILASEWSVSFFFSYPHLWRSTETAKHQINSFAVRFAQTFMILL